MKLCDAALRAHDAGVAVIPILGDGTKKPPFAWGHFRQTRAPRSTIEDWFAPGGYTGFAAICGAGSGNLEVLDFDDESTYQTFIDTGESVGLGDLLTWMRWGYEERTPDGGTHLLYRCDAVAGNTKLAQRPPTADELVINPDAKAVCLIETRAEGGYAILAPSNGTVHPSGRGWTLISGSIDDIPTISGNDRDKLFALAKSFDEMPPIEEPTSGPGAKATIDSNRPGDAFRAKHASLNEFRSIVEPHGWVLTHHRGDVGYFRRPGKTDSWSATFGHGGYDYFYVFSSSTEFDQERGYNPFSVYAILNHNGDWVEAARELGRQGYGDPIVVPTAGRGFTGGPSEPPDDSDPVSETRPGFALTDMGNAERLVWDHGLDIRFCHTWNKWLVWDGTRFAVDDIGAIESHAKTTVRAIYQEAAQEEDDKARAVIAKHAKASEASPRVRAMIDLSRSEPNVPVRPGNLDRDQFLLNCANGTLNLKSGNLSPHARDDLITKRIATSYDPGARCSLFLAFLDTIMGGDQELVGFLQRAAGYSLTGSTVERVIFILHGGGKNGKSTLIEVLAAVLGDYALRTPTDTLLAKRDQGIPNDIARLQHLRLVYASEAEEGQRLAEAKIKDMTGGDTMTARFLHGEFFDFVPAFKLWFSTNHKPTIRGTDMAIWDRIRLVPFDVRIPPDQQDKHLRQKLIAESSGILAWAVGGCLEWQRSGLQEPECVVNATADYRNEMDVLGEYIAECCVIDVGALSLAGDLYKSYENWSKASGEKQPLTARAFANRLKERGFEQFRTMKARGWKGIAIKNEDGTYAKNASF